MFHHSTDIPDPIHNDIETPRDLGQVLFHKLVAYLEFGQLRLFNMGRLF